MRILYSAPDIDLNARHGGASHVIGAANSFANIGNYIYLIVKNGRFENKRIKFYNIKFHLFRQIIYFLIPFIVTFILCLFKEIDLIYERARIFGGGAILVGRIFGKKTIYEMIEPYTEAIIYTNQIKNGSFTKRLIDSWHNFIIKNSDIVTITHESFLKTVPKNKALLIKTGVDLKNFNEHRCKPEIQSKYELTKNYTLLYAGSFAKWHMLENLISAVRIISKKHKKIKLVMIGDGEKFNECKNIIKLLNLEKNVILIGKVNYDEISHYINASDICFALFDRNYLPFKKMDYFYSPIKINEYKACGKPIIASGIGTLNNLIRNNVNGILINEQNPEEIADAIKKLLKNNKLRNYIIKNNKSDAQNFNWDKINIEILNSLSSH